MHTKCVRNSLFSALLSCSLVLAVSAPDLWADQLLARPFTYPSLPQVRENNATNLERWKSVAFPQRQIELLQLPDLRTEVAKAVQVVQTPDILQKEIEKAILRQLQQPKMMNYGQKLNLLDDGWRAVTLAQDEEQRLRLEQVWTSQAQTAFSYPVEIRQLLRDYALNTRKQDQSVKTLQSTFLREFNLPEPQALSSIPAVTRYGQPYALMRLSGSGNPEQWQSEVLARLWGDSSLSSFWTGLRATESALVAPSLEKGNWPLSALLSQEPPASWLQTEGPIIQITLPIAGWFVDDSATRSERNKLLRDAAIFCRSLTQGPGAFIVKSPDTQRRGSRIRVSEESFNYNQLKPGWIRELQPKNFPFLSTALAQLDSGRSFYEVIPQATQGLSFEQFAQTPYFFLLQRLFPGSLVSQKDWNKMKDDPHGFVARHLTKVILADFQGDLDRLSAQTQWNYTVDIYFYY